MSSSRTKKEAPGVALGQDDAVRTRAPGVYEALETEAWFRRIRDEDAGGRGRKRRGADAPRGKDVVFEEALRWFLAHFERHPPEHFDRVKQSWRRTAFWFSDDVLERCRSMAQRNEHG